MHLDRQFLFLVTVIVILFVFGCRCEEEINENVIDSNEVLSNEEDTEKFPKGWNVIKKLREQIKMKEAELENAEKINKNFERMIQLVNIMGQVDTFLTDRTRMVLKKLAMLADDMDGSKSRKSMKYDIKF
ncbi:PREDICTED: uncharacterized protein LOC108560065 [Nicrophorus vespilloides]|uniref:Uncharacterized protein LOC108560065 n=1 Tax=Nicrophorus vespilloides TaxID=110193 RepID=A0ABM1MEI2_NICVS|nr:PREDICTED: uncharacterized protein LOC108560065 [Nicrophorus vespilloides]